MAKDAYSFDVHPQQFDPTADADEERAKYRDQLTAAGCDWPTFSFARGDLVAKNAAIAEATAVATDWEVRTGVLLFLTAPKKGKSRG